MIRKHLLALAAAALALGSSAQAATYNFNGTIEQGALAGLSFGGQFSFDDTLLTADTDWLPLTSLSFSFNGQTYTLAGAEANSTSASFWAGELLGVDAVYGTATTGLVLTNGFGNPYLADTAGNFGSYSVSAVPEPSSWALAIAGLAVVGGVARRRQRHLAAA